MGSGVGNCRVCTSCCHHSVHEFTNKVLKPAGLIVFADSVARPCHHICAFSFHPITHSAPPPLFIDIVTHLSIVPLLFIHCHLADKKKLKTAIAKIKRCFFLLCVCVLCHFNQCFLLLFPEEGYVKMYLKGRPITMFMPKEQVDGYCLEAKGELPCNKLKLDWVYPLHAAA